MQYLYDSGDDAVFMDNRDYEQIEIPGELAGDAMRWMLPNDEVDILFVDDRPTDVQVPSAVELKVTTTEPGVKGDTASGGGSKAGDARVGGRRSRSRSSSTRARRSASTPAAASTSRAPSWPARRWPMRRSDQRRDAVFACYQRDVTGRPLDELLADARPFTRELALGVESHREELDAVISRHAKGWDLDRIAPLERNVMRVALYEIEHSDDVPTEVAIDEAVKHRQGVLRVRRARLRQRDPRRRGPRGGSADGRRAGGREAARDLATACRRSPPSSRATSPTTSGRRSWPARPPSSPARRSSEANRRIREADARDSANRE